MGEEEHLARGEVYGLLSAAFAFPAEPVWARLWGEESRRALGTLAELGADLRTALEAFSDSGRERFVAEYSGVFGFTSGGGEIPPYEGPYGATNFYQEADCTADVAGFYRAFGLESSEASPERPDHIAVELEFMHFLVVKEGYALSKGWAEKGQVCREAQKVFLKEHLGRWAPVFLHRLAERTRGGVFESIANAAAAWIAAECRCLEVPIQAGELRIASFDSPATGVGFSCGADSCGADVCGSQPTTMSGAPAKEAAE
ncbi:MAG: molecular chaperone TorD family protein [Gammaproteobacteria bacterium]|nr:molecular chaperone TorD family protein [Gammaproteobacteria bacterium]